MNDNSAKYEQYNSDEACSEHQLLTCETKESYIHASCGNTRDSTVQLDDVLSDLKFGFFQMKMLTLVGAGYFAVCAEMMLFIFLSTPAKREWNLVDYEFPWLPFSTGMAGIMGGFLFGTLSDCIGRRVPFIVGMTCIAVFGVVSAFANSFPLFIVFRCFVNFGIAAFEATGFVLLLGKCHINISLKLSVYLYQRDVG